MKWFDNPRKRRRSPAKRRKAKSRRKPPKGFSSWQAWSRAMRARIGKKGGSMARRKRSKSRRRSRRRSSRRARSTAVVRVSNPRRHRRYRRRSNPRRFSIRGLVNSAIQGAQDGLWVVGGKAITNAIPSLLGLSATGPLGIGLKALSAVGAGFVFNMVNANAGKLATAAGFAAIYEPFIKQLNIPIISPALAADDEYEYLSAYPDEPALAAYPQAVGAYPSDYAQQY